MIKYYINNINIILYKINKFLGNQQILNAQESYLNQNNSNGTNVNADLDDIEIPCSSTFHNIYEENIGIIYINNIKYLLIRLITSNYD